MALIGVSYVGDEVKSIYAATGIDSVAHGILILLMKS